MVCVEVCIGSSCHLKGSYIVVERLKEFIVQKDLTEKVELKASFCMEDCLNGVCVTINGKKIRKVTGENVVSLLEEELKALGEL